MKIQEDINEIEYKKNRKISMKPKVGLLKRSMKLTNVNYID